MLITITSPVPLLSHKHRRFFSFRSHFQTKLFGGQHNRKLQLFPQYFYVNAILIVFDSDRWTISTHRSFFTPLLSTSWQIPFHRIVLLSLLFIVLFSFVIFFFFMNFIFALLLLRATTANEKRINTDIFSLIHWLYYFSTCYWFYRCLFLFCVHIRTEWNQEKFNRNLIEHY